MIGFYAKIDSWSSMYSCIAKFLDFDIITIEASKILLAKLLKVEIINKILSKVETIFKFY